MCRIHHTTPFFVSVDTMWSILLLCLLVGGSHFVNLVAEQGLKGQAAMGARPQSKDWSADKVIDGNTNQSYLSNSCAITDVDSNLNTSIWWKVWLQRQFNVAYLEIYFRSDTFQRSAGFSIYTYNTHDFYPLRDPKHLVYRHDPLSGCPSPIQNVTVNNVTQGIVFINERPPGYNSTCHGDNKMYTGIELCEIKVMGCDQNKYSAGCEKFCRKNCSKQWCDVFNGSCIHGCIDVNALTTDCIVCKDKTYIENRTCVPCHGHCKDRSQCNKLTGRCDKGCKKHWTGDFCQECSLHYYGSDCDTTCGQCRGDYVCNNVTGHCPNGCKEHWQGPRCDECIDKFYGKNCTSPCGNCKNKVTCDMRNGSCPNGCEPHFTGSMCQECIDGYFGVDCDSLCKHCNRTLPTCGRIDGHCLYGCEGDEWKAGRCDLKRLNDANEEKADAASISGGVLAAILFTVLFGLLGFFLKRRLVPKREKPPAERRIKFTSNQSRYGNAYADDNKTSTSHEENSTEATIEDDGGYYNVVEFNTYLKTDELESVILEKNSGENSIFVDEFKRLPVGDRDKCTVGQKPENVVRNRFKNLFPYDHSRIILKEKWSDEDNDYINADYIKDYNKERTYIATQGPTAVTVADFWRMILQEDIMCIVMLTNVVENGKTKCIDYWPEKENDLQVGPCVIKIQEETVFAVHIERIFTVEQYNNTGDITNKRTITQFHYTAWPDHGTPEELGLVQFHRAVTKKYQTRGLMLVHCSAGVGRTGTFIGLDSLLKQGRESGRINVFEFVKQMREDRMNMVQTEDQYIFLHSVLLCGLQEKNTVIFEDDIFSRFQSLIRDSSPFNMTELYKEFKYLQTLKPLYEDEDKRDGKSPENISKNKDMKIIPVPKYRPFLTSYVKGRNDYINAVLVPSFTNRTGFIITQYPLDDTEVDFWRLCVDHNVQALIFLQENNEMVPLIPKMDSTRCCGPYTLILEDAGSTMGGVCHCSLIISIDEQRKKTNVFSLACENGSALVYGVKLLLENGKQQFSTTVVISKDGAGPTGVFCVLHNVLQQLRMDKEVDIFTAVRQVQTRRPEVITKLDDYRRCYELVLQSISDEGIYANM